ncbi:MAG: ImmA/IrrE family metallo-endopeptidase [Syntrophales bacterium]|nr:ImmA/IrrE family metallo-endopeptidase [Syntrophales bacterium]
MKRVINKANQLNEQFGNDLDRITDSLGLSVMYEEMTGRMKEFYFRGAIVVRSDLSVREKRELIAHALGHHLFHAGNHLAMQKRIYSFGNYHEKQANAFAACLLIPLSKLSRLIADRARIDEIADNFRVTEELVRLRLMIWANFEKDLSGSSARVG